MFHVPEYARVTRGPMASDPGTPAGSFVVDSIEPGWVLVLICDDGRAPGDETGWEHVSVHADTARGRTRSRVPTWREMVQVKDLIWDAEDAVVQFHPPRSSYVNTHPDVLHLWRPIDVALPTPPVRLV